MHHPTTPHPQSLHKAANPGIGPADKEARTHHDPCTENKKSPVVGARGVHGGDEGVRTLGLRLAKPALSQLSYVPS